MNLVNRLMSGLFDVLMTPFELLGAELALILVSGIVGIACLILFKYISWQDGIKRAKDKIKGSMIAIRIYQDDLVIVARSVCSVFLRNFQYLGLNFGPILPLLVPFVLVLSQFVVRYAYDPIPVVSQEEVGSMLSGEGTMVTIELKSEHANRAKELHLELPEGIVPITKLARSASTGQAFVEIAAVESVRGEIRVFLGDDLVGSKKIVAGNERTRTMQPVRTSSFWLSWMFPAEDTLGAGSPLASVEFHYPNRELAYIPDGEIGILVVFFLASIVFGAAVIKPLRIQI